MEQHRRGSVALLPKNWMQLRLHCAGLFSCCFCFSSGLTTLCRFSFTLCWTSSSRLRASFYDAFGLFTAKNVLRASLTPHDGFSCLYGLCLAATLVSTFSSGHHSVDVHGMIKPRMACCLHLAHCLLLWACAKKCFSYNRESNTTAQA